jgi:hypothetical protein
VTTEVGGGARKGQNGHRTKKNGHAPEDAAHERARVPPHNLDAERSLLGGVLLDREAPLKEIFAVCSATDFYRDAHRKIAEAMVSCSRTAIPVDRISVSDRLTERGDLEAVGGAEYLDSSRTSPGRANLAYYAKIVHDKARARKLIEAATARSRSSGTSSTATSATSSRRPTSASSAVVDGDATKKRRRCTSGPSRSRATCSRRRRRRGDTCCRFRQAPRHLPAREGRTLRGRRRHRQELRLRPARDLARNRAHLVRRRRMGTGRVMRVLLLAGEDDREELERRLFFSGGTSARSAIGAWS